jgi:hypothetical protein
MQKKLRKKNQNMEKKFIGFSRTAMIFLQIGNIKFGTVRLYSHNQDITAEDKIISGRFAIFGTVPNLFTV